MEDDQFNYKRWDRYSASFTTQDKAQVQYGLNANLKIVSGLGEGSHIAARLSRQPEDIGRNMPKLNIANNLPPLPPS